MTDNNNADIIATAPSSATSTTTTTTTNNNNNNNIKNVVPQKALHLDDIIIKCLEEIALNGSRGLTPEQMFAVVQDTFGPINVHLKNFIHKRILDHSSIHLIDDSTYRQMAPLVNKPDTNPMSLLKKIGDQTGAGEDDLIILSSQSTTGNNKTPSKPTPSTPKKKPAAKKAAAKGKKTKEEEEKEKEEAANNNNERALVTTNSSEVALPDNSIGVVYQIDTLETPKKATGMDWRKQHQTSTEASIVSKQKCLDWNNPIVPFSYVANKDLRRKACGMAVGEPPLNDLQTKILEAVANSRYNGIPQSELSDMFGIDSRNIFNPIKTLHVKGYIVKCEVYKSGLKVVQTRMIYLTRFFSNRVPLVDPWKSKTAAHEMMTDYLSKCPDTTTTNADLKSTMIKYTKTLGTYKLVKKTLIQEGYIESFKRRVDANGQGIMGTEVYPNETTTTASSLPILLQQRKKEKEEHAKEEKEEKDEDDEDQDSPPTNTSGKKTPKKRDRVPIPRLVDYVKLIKLYDPLAAAGADDNEGDEDEQGGDMNDRDMNAPNEAFTCIETEKLQQMFEFIKNAPRSLLTKDIAEWMGPNYSLKHISSGLRTLVCYYKLRVFPFLLGKVMAYKYFVSEDQLDDQYLTEHITPVTPPTKSITPKSAATTKSTTTPTKKDKETPVKVKKESVKTPTKTPTKPETPSSASKKKNKKQDILPTIASIDVEQDKMDVDSSTTNVANVEDLDDDKPTTTSTTSTTSSTTTNQVKMAIKIEEEMEQKANKNNNNNNKINPIVSIVSTPSKSMAITTPPATPSSQITLFGQILKNMSSHGSVISSSSTPHRKFARSVQFLVRKKMVYDLIVKEFGMITYQLLEYLHDSGDPRVDLKTLNNVLTDLKGENQINIIRMYFNKNAIDKTLIFAYDAKYSLDDPIIKKRIGQIKDNNINMKTANDQMEKETIERYTDIQLYYNKKVALQYGMIHGQFMRTKAYHIMLFKYCASLYHDSLNNTTVDNNNNNNNNNNNVDFEKIVLPDDYCFYLNSFLKSLTTGDYCKVMPQYKTVEGLIEKITQSVKVVDLPIQMRCKIFTKNFMKRFVARIEDLIKLGAARATSTIFLNSRRKLNEFQLLHETTLNGQEYMLNSLKGITTFWTALERLAVGQTDNQELIGKFGINVHSPLLWGLSSKASRLARQRIIAQFVSLARPLTNDEKIQLSIDENIRVSYIDTMYQRFLYTLNTKSQKPGAKPRRPSGVPRVRNFMKRKPKPSIHLIRQQRWSHIDDRRLLNFVIELFTPFFKSLKDFDYTVISANGVPQVENPLWSDVAEEFERPYSICHKRVNVLLKKYPSYKHKIFEILPYHQNTSTYDLVLPDSIDKVKEKYDFKETRTRRDVWAFSNYNSGELVRLRDKCVFVVSLPESEFEAQVGKEILGDKDMFDVIGILNSLLLDRLIIRLSRSNQSRRYILPKNLFAKPVDGDLFFDECKQLLKVYNRENETYFTFNPYSSGGTVAEAIYLMANSTLIPSVSVPSSLKLSIRPHSRSSINHKVFATGKIDKHIEPVSIGFYKSSINESYSKIEKRRFDDEEYIKGESRFMELIDDDEEEEKNYSVEPTPEIDDYDEDEIFKPKKQKVVKLDNEEEEQAKMTPFKQLVEEQCKSFEFEEMKRIFYLGAMVLEENGGSEELERRGLLKQTKETELIWKKIKSAGLKGIDFIELCKYIIQHRLSLLQDDGQDLDDQDKDKRDLIAKDYSCVIDVKSYIQTLRTLNYIQQLYGSLSILYVDTLEVADMMLPLPPVTVIPVPVTNKELYSKTIMRPWVNLDGTIDTVQFNLCLRDIAMYVMSHPGIQLAQLSYRFKIPPTLLSLLMSILSDHGYTKTEWYISSKPSLFSKQTQPSFQVIPQPTNILEDDYDPNLSLNQFYNPLPNIINLESHLSYLISLYNL
ncbi:winged helix DNA-binding domain-containing protein [Cavenderia fasciculata]|uniref:Winged helix DNA-binding domain-containing protein n=1 Tax=Cavenderia fasciculata TaxID=261658 RepID=F4Q6C7_CACFS|nr:winged helix DNA-binding domain-containing protein [Cavenderia fasciculata]EGG16437.1 winged helix DNA-binding domain-containing protein [Cavenderia fasciculata]|eukprot:XP_004354837.1 winged helix DNA-binding domain-containing protein [Cavenderia fasciculata]